MKYSSDVVQQAYAELDQRRQDAISEQAMHVDRIQKEYPQIYEVYHHITNTSHRLADAVFSKSHASSSASEAVDKIKQDNLASQKKLEQMLVACGFPKDYLRVKYHCPSCSDTGIYNGNRCKCVTELLNKYNVLELNKQCKIKLHSFAEFDLGYYPEVITYNGAKINCRERMEQNLKFCMDYVKDFSPLSCGIFMLGGTGLGKTFLSSCIAKSLIEKGVNVAFDSIQNYLRQIEKEHFGKTDGDTLETLLGAELLILDDLGCEFSSQFNTSTIYNILNSRCNMSLPTIVSSNLDISALTERYDQRIVSRLIGTLYTLRFVGEDIRQIKMRKGIYD